MMQNNSFQHLLVTGVSSQVGGFLLHRLIEENINVTAISRSAQSIKQGVDWIHADIAEPTHLALENLQNISVVLHLAPLPLLLGLMPKLIALGVKRIIAFSTTSCFTKRHAQSAKDAGLAEQFHKAEIELQQICQQHQIAWTIFRPTLIYSDRDKNINFIACFIRRFGFFPLVGEGRGLRQPVHADDLAKACMQVLTCQSANNNSYNLSGLEVLSYKEMVTKIFHSQQKKPRWLVIPLPIMRSMLFLLSLLPKYKYITADMADRMNADHDFEHLKASQDFGYSPRAFIL